MTIDQEKNKVVLTATEELGTREGPDNENKYAAMPEMTQLLGWDAQNQPWCNIFVNACFIACFGLEIGAAMLYQPIGSGSALCRASADFFKAAGAWIERGRTPEPGDVIFFYRSGDINHMGIVARVASGSIVTVEGNSGDSVAERCYSVGDNSIAGYGRPDWAVVEGKDIDAPTTDAPPAETCTPELPTVRFGDVGPAVAAVQAALRFQGFDPHWIDGEAGERTERQIKAFQNAAGLSPDGVCGEETYTALFRKKIF